MGLREVIFFVLLIVTSGFGLALILPARAELSRKQEALLQLQTQDRECDHRIALLQKQNVSLQSQDKETIIRFAREYLNMCFEDEVVFTYRQ